MTDPDAQQVPEEMVANILPIIRWPDKRLNNECEPIQVFDAWLEQLSIDLLATMDNADGIGLAAPQVGVMARVCSVWIEHNTPIVLVNPEIVESSEDLYEWEEGCLSVPGYFEKRKRPQRAIINYQDLRGRECQTEFQGLYAFAVQHEIDHLDGKLFVDGVSKLKESRIKVKIKNYLKRRQSTKTLKR